MEGPRWSRRALASTRGQILAELCGAQRTVTELAEALGVSRNAIRVHLSALERDGLVTHQGVHRGIGKPAYLFALTPEAESVLSRAYRPVLGQLLNSLARRLREEELEALLREVGRDLAAQWVYPAGDVPARVEAAAAVMEELGGVVTIEEADSTLVIHGDCCPLAGLVPVHPQTCKLMEALVSTLIGDPVQERCIRDGRPSCRLMVMSTADR